MTLALKIIHPARNGVDYLVGGLLGALIFRFCSARRGPLNTLDDLYRFLVRHKLLLEKVRIALTSITNPRPRKFHPIFNCFGKANL